MWCVCVAVWLCVYLALHDTIICLRSSIHSALRRVAHGWKPALNSSNLSAREGCAGAGGVSKDGDTGDKREHQLETHQLEPRRTESAVPAAEWDGTYWLQQQKEDEELFRHEQVLCVHVLHVHADYICAREYSC